MRLSLTATSLLAALALVGCGDDDDSRTPSGPPVAADDFCAEFVDAFCDRIAACNCSPTADADCRADLADTCGRADGILGSEARARIDAGKVTYDAAAAGALFARVRASTSCENPLLTLGWAFPDVLTFGGVFRGTTAPGAACTDTRSPVGGECANGICQETMEGGICIGLAGRGAACGMGMPFLCADTAAPFTGFDDPDILLRCNVPMGATTGICADPLATGATCEGSRDCASSICEGMVCAPQRADGATCADDGECVSGFCERTPDGGTCRARTLAPVGAACTDSNSCESDECRDGVCVAGICALYDPPAPPPAM
jgi:hypothetical protein